MSSTLAINAMAATPGDAAMPAMPAPEASIEILPMTAEQKSAATERETQTQLAVRRRREQLAGYAQSIVPGLVGILIFLLLWQGLTHVATQIPGPAKVWDSAVKLFSDPFYRKGPNDQGIGWNILASLQRVGMGFGLAALVGIPAGFMIGRFEYLNRMTSPIISLLRPVSPLAWLPIGLMVFKAANPAAIWVIFI